MSKNRDSEEDQRLGEKVKAGEPLIEQVVHALRRHHEAQDTQLRKKWRSCASKRKYCSLLLPSISVTPLANLHLSFIERHPKVAIPNL